MAETNVSREIEQLRATVAEIGKKTEFCINALNERMNRLRAVMYDYLEAGSSIALSTVKANLRSI